MVGHLNSHMGMSPKGEPQMHHSLAQSLQQEEEDRYDDDGRECDGEEEGAPGVRGEHPKCTRLSLVPVEDSQKKLALLSWSFVQWRVSVGVLQLLGGGGRGLPHHHRFECWPMLVLRSSAVRQALRNVCCTSHSDATTVNI